MAAIVGPEAGSKAAVVLYGNRLQPGNVQGIRTFRHKKPAARKDQALSAVVSHQPCCMKMLSRADQYRNQVHVAAGDVYRNDAFFRIQLPPIGFQVGLVFLSAGDLGFALGSFIDQLLDLLLVIELWV